MNNGTDTSLSTIAAGFFTNPRYRRVHAVILAVALLLHLFLHYATYIPALREPLANLPYFRLHVLHEAEFLLIIVYAALVFRLKGGLAALSLTALASIPFLMTPYIFGREPRPGEVRDLAIEVGMVLLMGLAVSLLYEAVARERERRSALAVQLEQANVELSLKNQELQLLNRRLETSNRQLEALNRMTQEKVNRLYDDLNGVVNQETSRVDGFSAKDAKQRFRSFLTQMASILAPEHANSHQ